MSRESNNNRNFRGKNTRNFLENKEVRTIVVTVNDGSGPPVTVYVDPIYPERTTSSLPGGGSVQVRERNPYEDIP